MSRTYRRASWRNAGARNPEWSADRINAKVVRDGRTIRGCNGDACAYCADNRLHATRLAREAANDQLRNFHTEDM